MVKSLDKFGIAIAAGNASDLLIVDVDKRNGGYGSMKALTERLGELPKTPTVITGGGGVIIISRSPPANGRSASSKAGIESWSRLRRCCTTFDASERHVL